MFEFSFSKDIYINKGCAIGKVVAHLCLTLIVKELKNSVEQGRVVPTLNIIKHYTSYVL